MIISEAIRIIETKYNIHTDEYSDVIVINGVIFSEDNTKELAKEMENHLLTTTEI